MTHFLFLLVYGPGSLFVSHPERSLFMAAGFAILCVALIVRSGKIVAGNHLLLMMATALWIAYSLWECRALQAGWNIRVDLLLLWPPVFVVSMVAAWLGIRSLATPPAG